LDVASERVVEKAGVPLWQFHEPQTKIPGVHFFHLLGYSARALGDEKFGLLVAEKVPLRSLGSLGQNLQRATSVYDAIKTLTRLVALAQNTSKFWIVEDNQELWWFRRTTTVADYGYRQVEISTLAWMIDAIRTCAGPDWRPARIRLESGSIPGLEGTENFSNAEIHYGQGVTGLAVPRSLLSQRIYVRGASTAPVEDDGLLSEAPSGEFVASLRQVLRSFLIFEHPQIETIAEIAGLKVRTLQRRFAAEGLTFKTVVDQARFQAAADLMDNPDVKLIEIAHDLGYSDQAHFTRAFRRWAGVSPSEYRLHQHPHLMR
jgi:AraC-like DNA-binding protein